MKLTFKNTLIPFFLLLCSLNVKAQSTVFSLIAADPDLQKFEEAIVKTGLQTTFSTNGTYTIFAPTNAAMDAVPGSVLNSTEALKDFILTHVVVGYYKKEHLVNGYSISTINLRNLTVKKTGTQIIVNGATIIVADKFATNGIVHKIDKVIFKNSTTATTVMSIISNSPNHTVLETIITKARQTDTYTSSNNITVFAPTDEAFFKLSSTRFNELIGTNINYIKNYLDYHIVNKVLTINDLKNGVKFTANNNQELSITVNINGTYVNNIKVTFAGLQATNGIVYVIKDVIIPQSLPKYTVLDYIDQSLNHKTLKKYVAAAGLSSKLDAKGTLTYFAATDNAFAKLDAKTITALESDPQGVLKEMLENHLLSSKEYIDDLLRKDKFQAINGYELTVKRRFNGTYINDSKLSITDIEVDNGLVHVIDAVLIVEDIRFTVQDILQNNPILSSFNAIVKSTNIDSLLNSEGPFTVFAPSNEAMMVLPTEVQEAISNNDKTAISDFINNHIVRQHILGIDFVDQTDITARNGFIISVIVNGNNVMINGIPLIVKDIIADNGVVHLIDVPLFKDNRPNTIYRYLNENDNHSILTSLIEKAELQNQFDDANENLTIFAPTNDALLALGDLYINDLLSGALAPVVALIQKHTLNSAVTSDVLSNASLVLNAGGGTLTITVFENDIYINNAKIIVKNIELDNGIIHVIDAVLVDPILKNTLWDIILASEELKLFKDYTIAAQLENKYELEAPITVFAPTDNAFEQLSPELLEALNNNTDDALLDFFLYHTYSNEVALEFNNGPIVLTMQNDKEVVLTQTSNGIYINNAKIITNAKQGDNGVIYEIDAVIEPPIISQSIYDYISENDSLSTLKTMVDNAGLVEFLKDTNDITFFAPSNNAFNVISPDVIDALNNDPNGLLKDFLQRHIYNVPLSSSDMFDNLSITMSNNESVVISVRFDGFYINDARITTQDIQVDNGVIHIINSVINPLRKSLTAYDIISSDASLTTFKTSIDNANLISSLKDSQLVTVFAATDNAFAQLDPSVLMALQNDPNGLLRDALRFHFTHDLILSNFIFNGSFLTMDNGNIVNVSITPDGIFINDARIITKDIIADNGVVHIIDKVIMPIKEEVTIYDLISHHEDLGIFKTAIDTSDLRSLLQESKNLTVFAPTDQAFNAIPTDIINRLFDNIDDEFKNILLGHMIEDNTVTKDNLLPNIQLNLANNTIAVINLKADGLYINNSKILVYDITVDNGIVHIIDAVMLPESTSTTHTPVDNSKLIVSPNPTQDWISLNCGDCQESKTDLRIYNSQGQLIHNVHNYAWNTNLNVAHFADGIYFLSINSNNPKTISFIKN